MTIWKYLFFESRISYILQIIPFLMIIGFVFWIIRGKVLKKRGLKRSGFVRETLLLLFPCYIAGLLMLIATPANLWSLIWFRLIYGYSGGEISPLFSGEFNFVPTIFRYITGELTGGSWVVFMLLGNILLFLPFGFLLPMVWEKKTFAKYICVGIVTTVVLELIQPIMGRSFDIDDLIMNTIGFLTGYCFYIICTYIYKKYTQAE
ncbi:MAG: VanZ family protein [Tannerellaceae bacterium]|nr:VanZ family protein [Tannerellaceae bacterium]